MSTRLKLFLSYLLMGFLPIILMIAVTLGVLFRVVTASPFLMSLDAEEGKLYQGFDELLNVEAFVRNNPEGLYDQKVLTGIDAGLNPFHVGIILLDSDKQVFYISQFLNGQTLMQDIRTAEQTGDRSGLRPESGHYSAQGYQRLNTQTDFTVLRKPIGGEKPGVFYLVIETGSVKRITSTFPHRFIAAVFWGMIGLIVLLTFLVTRSMMQSLKKLSDGVRHISEGDLNFSIKTSKQDEVSQVIMAFEEMRIRLKASINAQLEEDENRKELIASISHDLKTPVTAIKGYIEGLMDGVADTPEKKEKYLSTIHGKTIALDRMIDDLFLYSSLDIGRLPYHFEAFSAREFFENLCSETKLDLSERGFNVDCNVQIPPDAGIRADLPMLRRLQHNLTENASKYCKSSDRKVIFTALVKEAEVICSTEDNGIGIRSLELPHIFERFYRADAARTSTVGGTGLGLQISKRIAEDHGGWIRAESEYGEFTRISWSIPLLQEEGSLPLLQEQAVDKSNGQPETSGGDRIGGKESEGERHA